MPRVEVQVRIRIGAGARVRIDEEDCSKIVWYEKE